VYDQTKHHVGTKAVDELSVEDMKQMLRRSPSKVVPGHQPGI